MTDRILVVTAPDDVILDGIRLLVVNLTQEQTQIISNALLKCNLGVIIINYLWQESEPVSWMLDKRQKSDFVIFNADAESDTINGYLAAMPNSYYFGTLKDLQIVNDRAIYTVEDILTFLETYKK